MSELERVRQQYQWFMRVGGVNGLAWHMRIYERARYLKVAWRTRNEQHSLP